MVSPAVFHYFLPIVFSRSSLSLIHRVPSLLPYPTTAIPGYHLTDTPSPYTLWLYTRYTIRYPYTPLSSFVSFICIWICLVYKEWCLLWPLLWCLERIIYTRTTGTTSIRASTAYIVNNDCVILGTTGYTVYIITIF